MFDSFLLLTPIQMIIRLGTPDQIQMRSQVTQHLLHDRMQLSKASATEIEVDSCGRITEE